MFELLSIVPSHTARATSSFDPPSDSSVEFDFDEADFSLLELHATRAAALIAHTAKRVLKVKFAIVISRRCASR
jgi:hypothetical protein